MKLRTRLLIILVCLVASGLLVSDIVTYTSLHSYLSSQLDQQLPNDRAPMIRVLIDCLNQEPSPCQTPAAQGSTGFEPAEGSPEYLSPGTFGEMIESSGTVIAHAFIDCDCSTKLDPELPSNLSAVLSSNSQYYFTARSVGSSSIQYRVMAFQTVLQSSDAFVPETVTVIVAAPLAGINQTLVHLLLVEILVTLLVVVGLGALSWWVVRRGLRPLDEMTQTAGAIAAGDLSRRVTTDDELTEVGQLGSALNIMLGNIEQAFADRAASEERLRRFLADASHELRTPLTSIRGYAEMFDRGARDRPEDLALSMHHIKAEADRMGALVEDLFLLARAENERPLNIEKVDVVAILGAAVSAARVTSPDRQFSLQAPATAPVLGDDLRLRQIFDNLFTNAAKYTPPGTPVDTRLYLDGALYVIEVEDHGAGVAEEERDRIFEPFHRIDPSRNRSTGGMGLGLAIVRAMARAHGGDATVGSSPTGGAIFKVAIPAFVVSPLPNEPATAQVPGNSEGVGPTDNGAGGPKVVGGSGALPTANGNQQVQVPPAENPMSNLQNGATQTQVVESSTE